MSTQPQGLPPDGCLTGRSCLSKTRSQATWKSCRVMRYETPIRLCTITHTVRLYYHSQHFLRRHTGLRLGMVQDLGVIRQHAAPVWDNCALVTDVTYLLNYKLLYDLIDGRLESYKLTRSNYTSVKTLLCCKSLITVNGTLLYVIKEVRKVLLSTTSRFVSWVCCVCAEKRSCELNMFECAPGVCISPAWVCDGQPDCVDARDEFNCRQKVCSPEEFTCRSQLGECVPLTWMCDDNADCSDGSDEKACSKLGLPYSHVACPSRLLAH
ncbi:unnamed protein product [Timema podura]|uniref:Uncharacterized protein n=1 Tax=Timema podura TaxID=61482 RepID=A0ABN7ND52_TIMPD|nr:unnamed protein product [Timema podura]